ncbi:PAS domain-containing protein [Flavobacterium terrae]|uniref:PAS domain S-box-containing protein n=1 Tax=Flavobacterium terrae TaxID=415425 RepID=A0A1M6AQ97_9FLAO|nr:PAS domain-containing protein [Flavobacterium terrae]SHI38383.1 PAS domain S-box-containing protein [Flavobacterium terrae]
MPINTIERPAPIDKEVAWDKTQVIMSKTDKFGTIEYANEVFSDVSGYEDYELMAKPHNIIRHPDMPKVIFKVLWDNLKKGNNFHAIVKNMAKSGRYYWVITDFDIAKNEEGEIVHYFARRKAVPSEVITNHIEPLYKKLFQIEEASGLEAAEKYLIGFLEEKEKTYVEYILDIMRQQKEKEFVKQPIPVDEEEEEKRSFFARFFGL